MKSLTEIYAKFVAAVSALQSPFLLAIRLYWGYQLMQTGLGKLRHLDKITSFFESLNIPLPGLSAHFVAGLEFFGGILLMIGLGSRIVSLLMCVNMFVAYWTADHEALTSFFSDPGKFYAADPFTFLFVSLIVLIFGAGFFSLDKVIATRWMARKAG
jgi:putative oxidoreductase